MQLIIRRVEGIIDSFFSSFWMMLSFLLVLSVLATGSMNLILFSFGSKNPLDIINAITNYSISRPYYTISFLALALPLTIAMFLVQRDSKRLFGLLLLAGTAIPLTIFLVGIGLYSMFGHVIPQSLAGWVDFIFNAPGKTKSIQQFWLAEAVSFGLILGPIGYAIMQRETYFGSAHFANLFESLKEGFFKETDESIIIGKKYGLPVYSNGFEHVLCFAATGSGKTSSLAIPNLFAYPHSVVANDVKLSLYKTTSGYREKVLGHKCFVWAPADAKSKTHRFNPLSFISTNKVDRMTDIQRIAHALIPDGNGDNAIWSRLSRGLFKAIVLYLLDTPDSKVTLGEINRVIKKANFNDWLEETLTTSDCYDPEFYRNGFAYHNNNDRTRDSILIDLISRFELFDDPRIDAATSDSDFDLRALRREKMTIYVGFSDNDMERLSPILTLFWQQVISSMIDKVPNLQEEPYSVLCLMDEFSTLGRLEQFRRSLKLLREYRVRCVIMVQYLSQTLEKYNQHEAKAFTNIKTKLSMSTDDIQDAEYISKLLGTKTKKINTGSQSNQASGQGSQTRSYHYQAAPLKKPEEILRMKQGQCFVIKTGASPLMVGQYRWYKDSVMAFLVNTPTLIPNQKIERKAFQPSGSSQIINEVEELEAEE